MKLKEVGLQHGCSIPFPNHGRLQQFADEAFDLTDKGGEITIKCRKFGTVRITDKANCWWTPFEGEK